MSRRANNLPIHWRRRRFLRPGSSQRTFLDKRASELTERKCLADSNDTLNRIGLCASEKTIARSSRLTRGLSKTIVAHCDKFGKRLSEFQGTRFKHPDGEPEKKLLGRRS